MKFLVLAAVALCLSACASRPNNHIDADARSYLKTVDTVLVVTQSEIGTEINHSKVGTATGGGALGALIDISIDASRAGKAEELIIPIRDKLLDFDFAAVLEEDLESTLATIDIERLADVALVRGVDSGFMQNTVQETSADAVMFVDATYNVSADFSNMIVITDVKIFPANAELIKFAEKPDDDAKLTELSDNIYRNTFRTEYQMVDIGKRNANAEGAAELSADELTNALSEASKLMARQIADDILVDDANAN